MDPDEPNEPSEGVDEVPRLEPEGTEIPGPRGPSAREGEPEDVRPSAKLGRRVATPALIRALHAQGRIATGKAEALLEALGRPPSLPDQALLVGAITLSAGAALTLSGVIYFIAFNWAELGRMAKLGLAQGLLAAAALGAFWLRGEAVGRVLLVASCVLVGALLAVYGQIYQTGADVHELFLGWAALVLPWVLFSRIPGAWLLELALLDVGLARYWDQVGQHRAGANGSGDFFFQEGQAELYEEARYAELRVSESGQSVLVGLADAKRHHLGPPFR